MDKQTLRKGMVVILLGLGATALGLWLGLRRPGNHLQAATALHREGQHLVERGDTAKALPKLWEAYRIRRDALGLSDSNTLFSLAQLSAALEQHGDWTNALKLLPDLAQFQHDEMRRKYAEMARSATSESEGRLARQTLKMWEQTAPTLAVGAELQQKYVSNMMVYVRDSELSTALNGSAATLKSSIDADLGYTPEQIKALDKLNAAQARWNEIHREKMISNRMTDEDWKTYPIPASLGIKISLIPSNMPAKGVPMENHQRRVQAELAARDPVNYETLRRYNFYPDKPGFVDESWFRKAWQSDQERFEKGSSLSELLQHKAAYGTTTQLPVGAEADPRLMALIALNLKGLFLEREFRVQAALAGSKVPSVVDARKKARAAEVAAVRAAKDTLISFNEKNLAGPVTRLGEALDTIKAAQAAQKEVRSMGLSLSGTGRAKMVTPENVAAVLSADGVLVEFLHYGRDPGGTGMIEARYGAVVLAPGSRPKWIPLPAADEVKLLVERCMEILRRPQPLGDADRRLQAWDTELKATLTELGTRVWQPIAAAFPKNTRTVLVAPDGDLHRVAMASLLDGSRFVGDRFEIRYLMGGRDLLEKSPPLTEHRIIETWTDPDFDAVLANASKAPQLKTGWQAGGVQFGRLRESQREAELLIRLAGRFGTLRVRSHQDKEASESSLAGIDRPLILHLATHGKYVPLNDTSAGAIPIATEVRDQARLVEPLYRCALALAGANPAIGAWTMNDIAPPANDGLLLPVEAAQLNLRGTWLATLAACDTGVGGVTEGEGFFCLKLGVLQAGAQNVLFSLWPINSDYTPVFLQRFYEEALTSGDPAAALAKVQRAELNKLSSTPGTVSLWERVRNAGAFAVVSRGQQKPSLALTKK